MTPSRIDPPPALARRAWSLPHAVEVWELRVAPVALVLIEGRPATACVCTGDALADARAYSLGRERVRARQRDLAAEAIAAAHRPGPLPEPADWAGGPTEPSIPAVEA